MTAMPRMAAVPFTIRRSKDEFSATSVSSTTETAHGLLRLEGDRIIVQWRLARKTERYTSVAIKTDEDMEPVREVVVPLDAVATAFVRNRWWEFWRGPQMVLTAADLQAFDEVAGEGGLRLGHPAKMVVRLRRSDRMLAEEFTAELTLAVAEMAAWGTNSSRRLKGGPDEPE
ncbi:MAG: hypothetical protein ACQET1_07890 [Gemmatimonadota bacterium]